MTTYLLIGFIVLLVMGIVALLCQLSRERADNDRLTYQNYELSKRLADK